MPNPTAELIVRLATQQSLSITTVESCTGGLVAASLTDVAGSSSVFETGFVTYSNAAKQNLVGVSAQTLKDHGAVSEETVAEMAKGALGASLADIAIAVSGIAGPGGSDFKPEGRVCFAVADRLRVQTETREFGALGRETVRNSATKYALELILGNIKTLTSSP